LGLENSKLEWAEETGSWLFEESCLEGMGGCLKRGRLVVVWRGGRLLFGVGVGGWVMGQQVGWPAGCSRNSRQKGGQMVVLQQ